MEVDPPASVEPISLRILQLVQTAQAQHGIRHNDYDRYRQYCQRRLRKLYVSTKILHGRGRFVAKPIDAAMVTSARVLHIPLMNAERAWAYSQSLKAQATNKSSATLRTRALGRLHRASSSARELAALAAATCDAATCAEAEAYAAWMTALWVAERGQDWPKALAKYQRTRTLLEALDKVGDYELQGAVRQLLQQVEPAERFCAYQLERQGEGLPAGPALVALGDAEAAVPLKELQAGLMGVKVVSSGGSQGAPGAGAQGGSDGAPSVGLTWRGSVYPAYRDKVVQAIGQVDQARVSLEACMDSPEASEERLRCLEVLIKAYHKLVITIHKELQSATLTDAGGVSAEEIGQRLSALSTAARGLLGEASITRGLLVASNLEAGWRRGQERALLGGKGKSKEKAVKPEEVAAQYDSLMSLAHDMTELAGEVGGADAEHLMDASAAAEATFGAFRCFYFGVAALTAGRAEEAVVLLDVAAARADDAGKKLKECTQVDQQALQDIHLLTTRTAALRCAAHADCCAQELAEKEGVAEKLQGISMQGEGPGAVKGEGSGLGRALQFLADNLDMWESFAGEDGRPPRFYQLPPPIQPIPVRPLTLDSAQAYLNIPSIKHRYPQQATQQQGEASTASTFARFFTGWGGGAKK